MQRLTIGSRFDRWAGGLSSPIEGRVVLGPNWFASVMGTGDHRGRVGDLPVDWPVLDVIGTVAWLIAALLLVVLAVVVPVHWLRRPDVPRAIVNDPVAIQFFGAPPMALMTVGSATPAGRVALSGRGGRRYRRRPVGGSHHRWLPDRGVGSRSGSSRGCRSVPTVRSAGG